MPIMLSSYNDLYSVGSFAISQCHRVVYGNAKDEKARNNDTDCAKVHVSSDCNASNQQKGETVIKCQEAAPTLR